MQGDTPYFAKIIRLFLNMGSGAVRPIRETVAQAQAQQRISIS